MSAYLISFWLIFWNDNGWNETAEMKQAYWLRLLCFNSGKHGVAGGGALRLAALVMRKRRLAACLPKAHLQPPAEEIEELKTWPANLFAGLGWRRKPSAWLQPGVSSAWRKTNRENLAAIHMAWKRLLYKKTKKTPRAKASKMSAMK